MREARARLSSGQLATKVECRLTIYEDIEMSLKRCLQCNSLMPGDEVCCIRCGVAKTNKVLALELIPTTHHEQLNFVSGKKRCPKCGNVRLSVAGPMEGQCPNCGIFYHKYSEQKDAFNSLDRSEIKQKHEPVASSLAPCYPGLIASLSIFTGFSLLVCGIIWLAFKEDDVAVGYAQEGINHQITFIFGFLIPVLLSFSSSVLAGIVAIAWIIIFLVTPIIAAIKAFKGEAYRYPLVVHFFGDVRSE